MRSKNRRGTTSSKVTAAAAALVTTWALFGGGLGAATASQGAEAEFVSAINATRASQDGAPALTRASDLDQIAARHAAEMAARGAIFHNADLGRQVQNWTALGENVGVGPDVAALHQAFLDSPAHRANIVDARFGDVGIGMATTGEGQLWVVEVFRKPVAVAASAPPAAAPAAAMAPAPAATPAPAPAPAPVRRATSPAVPAARPAPAPIAAAPLVAPTPAVVEPAIVVVPETARIDLSVGAVRIDDDAVTTTPDATTPIAPRPATTERRSVQPVAALAALLWIGVAFSLLRSFRSAPGVAVPRQRLVVSAAALQSA